MKNALVLHGTKGSAQENWFPWLKKELEKKEFKVWVPDLPNANHPVAQKWIEYIFANRDWEFNDESVIIGHSAGAVTALALIQELPEPVVIKRAIMVGVFKGDLKREDLKDLVQKPWDFKKIKKGCKDFVFIHSDDDPYCPLDHAQWFADELQGKLVIKSGQGHFSLHAGGIDYPQYREFPDILEFVD